MDDIKGVISGERKLCEIIRFDDTFSDFFFDGKSHARIKQNKKKTNKTILICFNFGLKSRLRNAK